VKLEALAEIQRDDVAIKTSTRELQCLFVHGSQSKDIVLGCQRIESRVLKRVREGERYATSDFELWRKVFVWQRIWYGAGLGWSVGVAKGLCIAAYKLIGKLSRHTVIESHYIISQFVQEVQSPG